MGGGKSSTTTQSVQIPPEVMARYRAVNLRAEQAAEQPFQAYTGQFVAPLTQQQQAGMAGISQAAGMAQPYYGAAAGLTAAGSRGVGPLTRQQIQYYQDPFTESVVQPTLAALRQQQGQERAMQQAQAIRSGGFGGDRAGLERANLARQQALGTAQAIAPLYSQGYGIGVQTAAGQQGVVAQDLQRQLAAGQQFAGLGTGAQQAALQGAQAQIGAGTLEQQTQQADLTARYQQFLQERGYPFQVAQFLANIAMGTGALSGSTTTTTQPSSFFSDERMKENIKPIGETFDGQTIYKYNYKGEPGTQIGLIAQEVEHRKPEAVGMAGGMKTVDYDRATEEAGGIGKALASMGGAVREPGAYARGGFAPGGLVDPNDLSALIASQREALGPFGQSGLYGQKSDGAPFGGAGGIVPTSRLPVPKLVTAGPAPRQQEGGLRETMQDIAQVGKMTEKLGTGLDKLGKFGMSEEARKAATEPSVGQRMSEAGKTLSDIFGFAQRKNGGGVRPHYAAGGSGINPYGSKNDPMDYFPEEVLESGEQKHELMKPGQAPGSSGGSGLGNLASAVGTASTIATGISKAAPYLMAMFASDQRLKHDIEPIGKTYDGQNIYRYHMGDGAMRMGLMAQEVAERKPEAVAKGPEGYLMLDYDRATEDAAPRRGGVMPREGLQAGGVPEEDPTFALLRQKEGFRERPYFDVNAYRVGYGSDTMTTPEGRVVPVTKDVTVTREDAERDLARRVGEYQGGIRTAIGEERFAAMSPQARAALTSVAYNYGRLPESVVRAASEGDPAKIAAAVNALGTHNEGINARRRAAEAALIDPTGAYEAAQAQAAGVKPQTGFFGAPPKEFRTGKPFDSYGDFFMSKQFLVPFLSGVGAMASSPSRYLGAAALQGLGRGAEAYAALEKQQQDIAEGKAREVAGLSAIPISALIGEVGPDGQVQYRVRPDYFKGSIATPAGVKPGDQAQPSLPGGGLAGAQKTAIETGQQAVSGPVTVDPNQPKYTFTVSPQSETDAYFKELGATGDPARDRYVVPARIGTVQDLREKSIKDQATAQELSSMAVNVDQNRREANELVDATFKITPEGFAGLGPGQAERARALAIYDWGVKFAGLPGLSSKERENISSAQIIDKIRIGMGTQTAQQRGFSGQALAFAIQDANISGSLDENAALKLAASLYVATQRPQDFARYYDSYVKRYGTALNVSENFDKEMRQRYDREKKALELALKPVTLDGKRESVVMALRAGKISPQEFDNYYKTPGLARLIIGG